MDRWRSPDLVPSLQFADLEGAVEWFERVFGFRERAEARLRWPGGGTTWIEAGDALFNVATPVGPGDVPGTQGLVLKVYVEDVDAHHARAKAEGARILSEPEDGFWGGRIYRALDPEGHLWEISQRGKDLAAEGWRLPSGLKRGREE